MIKCSLVCIQEHFDIIDTSKFNQHYKDVSINNSYYDRVYVIFVTIVDGVGNYCTLEDRTLHLVLHVDPCNEAMIEIFEKNFLLPVEE